jgi:hypothetical protein
MELFSFMRRPPWRCNGCNFVNDVSDASDVLRWLVVALALSFFAAILACSREDIAGSSSVPASLNINAAATDLGQRNDQSGTNQTALLAESESSASNRRGSATGIASYYADTDGDIAPDFVKVCDQTIPPLSTATVGLWPFTHRPPILWQKAALISTSVRCPSR